MLFYTVWRLPVLVTALQPRAIDKNLLTQIAPCFVSKSSALFPQG